jgi:hypothetical protein
MENKGKAESLRLWLHFDADSFKALLTPLDT